MFLELMSATTENQNYFSSLPPPPPAPSKQPLPAILLVVMLLQLVRGGGGGPLSQRVNYCIDQTRPPPALFLGVDHIPEVGPSQVESGMYDDDTASEGRQGKFLLYWLTTTTTSTTTEFTKTTTVYSVICTPSGASECG